MSDEEVLAELRAKRERLSAEMDELHKATLRNCCEARAVEATIAMLIRLEPVTKEAAA